MLIAHLQVRTTKPIPPTLWLPDVHLWGVFFGAICYRPRGAGFPSVWFKFIYPRSKSRMTETSACTPVHVAYSPLAPMNHQWTINLHDGYPLLCSDTRRVHLTLSSHPLQPCVSHVSLWCCLASLQQRPQHSSSTQK